jgi:hypothetical protein
MHTLMRNAILGLTLLTSASAQADQAACDAIQAADVKTGSAGVRMNATGYAFARDTPTLYSTGKQTCSRLRDEVVDGQPTTVYREQYQATAGSTDATIWISKATGRLVREEQDGNIAGKGKGHISYQWQASP